MPDILLVPILTMKTFSDELRLKTDQLLLTAPVSLTKVVFAKFLSALTVYFIAVATSMLNFLFLAFHNYSAAGGIVLGLFLSMLLIGMACIAIGIFISSLTESQLVAVLLSMVVLAVASISHYLASLISVPWLRTFLSYFAIGGRYSYLAGGQFDFSAILYYLSISGVFLLLTIRVFERKRWH